MPLPDVLLLALCVGIGGVSAAADCRVKRVPNRILLIGRRYIADRSSVFLSQ